ARLARRPASLPGHPESTVANLASVRNADAFSVVASDPQGGRIGFEAAALGPDPNGRHPRSVSTSTGPFKPTAGRPRRADPRVGRQEHPLGTSHASLQRWVAPTS